MLKRFIGLTLCLALLFSMSVPVFAAQEDTESTERNTVEDILNQYHERVFLQDISDETGSAPAHFRSGDSSTKTLEEETVDALREAGYEAYNVTASNYNSLEDSLKMDFESLGIDSNGSYIIVISGEEAGTTTSSGARVVDPPHYDYGDEGIGSSSFSYTYNGTTYSMCYITVSGTENSNYRGSDQREIYNSEGLTFLNTLLSTLISTKIDSGSTYNVGTIFSIMGVDFVNILPPDDSQLTFYGGAIWTRKYVAVYDSSTGHWYKCVDTEYVTCAASIYAFYYSSTLNSYTGTETEHTNAIIYTPNYSNTSWLKEKAVLMYLAHSVYAEYTGPIHFYRDTSYMFTINEFYG